MLNSLFKRIIIIVLFLFIFLNNSFAEINRLNIIFGKKLNKTEKQYVLINLKDIPNIKSAFFLINKNISIDNKNDFEILVLVFDKTILNKNLYSILNPLLNISSNLKLQNIKLLFHFNKEIICQECINSIINHLSSITFSLNFEINKNLLLITPKNYNITDTNLSFEEIVNEIYKCSYEIYTPY